ncbi:SRPBCC domain-containing protein [uncultured Nitratireductor sp.]|uniref:SRPBCC family protein n=1 Tax=uncultured Nitratireductor sp. TaxID=520953 RepID=UPI0025D7F10F|nr:SRPBCC domain-containing protein [uncultured Nitratireductor sp.]
MYPMIDLTFERHIKASITTVWNGLTRSDLIAKWFFAVDFKPVVGHRFTLIGNATTGWRGWTNVEIFVLEPPHRMVWSFDCIDEAQPSTVEIRLEEREAGVQLTLMHTGEVPTQTKRLLEEGWNTYIGRLSRLCERIPAWV